MKSFPIYDNIFIPNKPNTKRFGLNQSIKLLTNWYFFKYDPSKGYELDRVNKDWMKEKTKKLSSDFIHVIDIEHWPSKAIGFEKFKSFAKLKEAAETLRALKKNMKFGFYSILPERNPNAAYEAKKSVSKAFGKWQAQNDALAHYLIDSVDYLFPSLYPLHVFAKTKDPIEIDWDLTYERWQLWAEETVKEGRRIGKGKPVIPYLLTYYHPNGGLNPLGWKTIHGHFIAHQLAVLSGIADGAVIYGDIGIWNPKWNEKDSDSWWQAVINFQRSKKSNPFVA